MMIQVPSFSSGAGQQDIGPDRLPVHPEGTRPPLSTQREEYRSGAASVGAGAADVAIIGAGLAGTSIATVAARAGHAVVLVDSHAVMPPEFRAEKLGQAHMDMFDDLGLGSVARGCVTATDDALVYRFGRCVEQARRREYGFAYSALINGLRSALPAAVDFRVARVQAVNTGPERQRIDLSDGTSVDARLVVVATGLGDAVRRAVGVRKVETRRGHSLSLGFTLAQPASAYDFENLTYYAARRPSPLAYITLFRIGDQIRANLFAYSTAGDAWTRQIIANPEQALSALMPEIAARCGGFAISGAVKVRPIDLTVMQEYRHPGVVLVGDAFCTTCPVPGVGIRRVMTDAARLCALLPHWLETPGMEVEKIGAFYDDPVKRAMDAQAMTSSLYARQMAIGSGPIWTARRIRNDTARRCLSRIAGVRRQFIGASAADRTMNEQTAP